MIDKRIFLVVAVFVLVVFASLEPLLGLCVGVGCGVGFVVAWFLRPIFDRWNLSRKKRNLLKLRGDVKRLEAELVGK